MLRSIAARLLFISFFVLPALSQAQDIATFRVRAYIDGSDKLHITGNSIRYEHLSFALPGKHGGNNYPTYINGAPWLPNWQGSWSDAYNVPGPNEGPAYQACSADLNVSEGRGVVQLLSSPTRSNNYEAVILVDDSAPGGPSWYEFTLTRSCRVLELVLARTFEDSTSCTTGELRVSGRLIAHTLEPPWRNNQSYVSSIPEGTYRGTLRFDKADRWRIQLQNVPGPRPGVQIHVGNYPTETEGCVLVGRSVVNATCALADSALAYEDLKAAFYGSRSPVMSPDVAINVQIRHNPARTEFTHSKGAFRLEGTQWQEIGPTGSVVFSFSERKRDLQWVFLFDPSLTRYVRLPLNGGMSGTSQSLEGPWNNLYQVVRKN